MWGGRKSAPQRASSILIIDADETATAELARQLGARGAHVFYTAAPHVGRRLSQEHYFDLVVVDDRIERETFPRLSEVVARDGHRCVILSVDADRQAFEADELTVRGALRRPLQPSRVYQLAVDVVTDPTFDGYRRNLDLAR